MKLDDMLNDILAEAEAINPDTIARIYGASSVLELAYFKAQKEILTGLVTADVFEEAGDPPRVMLVAALNILKHSFTQAMANLIMIGALDPEEVETSITSLLEDLEAALYAAGEEAARVAQDPEAHGFEAQRHGRG